MAIPRKVQIDKENPGYYHLTSRCVRRAFLCGEDFETGHNYEHRRQWIENRIIQLASIFSIEVYAYTVMSNHYHLVVYSDPQAPQLWSDFEVADKWLQLYPGKLDKPQFEKQRQFRLQAIMTSPELLIKYRRRLGSISWLMRRINEPLARMANAEDCCKGHFFESRFKSQALLDEAAALTCMSYVDLNPVRAGIAKNIDESRYTSIKKRMHQLSDEKLKSTVQSLAGKVRHRTMTIKLKDYVELVEWSGKSIIHPGKTSLPASIPSTLKKLNINQRHWLNQINAYGKNYFRYVGCIETIKAKTIQLRQCWLKGVTNLKKLYISQS